MPANYVLLERIELNASAASIVFANIPQTGYTDLKIVCSTRSDSSTNSGVYDNTQISVNGNTTGSNYSNIRLYGTGSATGSDSNASAFYTGASTGNAVTANTFANSEYYFPNYNSTTTFKSMSSDSTTENNATAVFQTLSAWLYKQNTAISSITVSLFSGANFVSGSTFSLYGLAALGTTPAIAPKASGGNVIATDGTYWYHAFRTSGTFTPQVGLTADVLVIAGGGGGGSGGAGAGGLTAFTSQSLANATNYTCTIGSGGSGAVGLANGSLGNDSQFGSLTLIKGGGWGSMTGATPTTGGSGGGAAANTTNFGLGTSGQGNNGGPGIATGASPYPAGAGGGAGAAGNTPVNSSSHGNGGAGVNTYSSWASATTTGVSGFFAGGGGGGYASGTAGTGGSGGGGAGGSGAVGTAGTVNTGGGGGGGYINSSVQNGGNGGSGIIIVRYPIA